MRLTGVLVALVAVAIMALEAVDRPEASVEAGVRGYATAVSNSDLDAALAEIAPDERDRWTGWIQGQLGNVYTVRGVAVRSRLLLDRLVHREPAGPTEVTTVLDVNLGDPDNFYQPTTRVPVERFEGRWYLAAPLLASD